MANITDLQRGPYRLSGGSQIRLLTLLDGADGTSIEASFQVADLTSKPKYAALSYQWGNVSVDEPYIYVEQIPVQIRRNLYNFLIHLRRRGTQTLWIDALCIDQADDEQEKSIQIPLMSQIYHQAQSVLAWLGEHDEYSQSVFKMQFNDRVQNGIKKLGPLGPVAALPAVPYLIGSQIGRHVKLTLNKDRIHDWESVLERGYFDRTWIIQELLLARRVTYFCGDDTMDQRLFTKSLEDYRTVQGRKFGKLLLPSSYLIHFAKAKRSHGWGSNKRYHEERDIFELVHDYSYTQCRDVKDKVYAVLSLETPSKKAPTEKIIVDPKESIHQLFVKVCNARLRRNVSDTTCERVAMLFKGLKFDKTDQSSEAREDDQAKHRNAEAVINLILKGAFDASVQGTIIKAFDVYGFIKPQRSYMITASYDPQQIKSAYQTWRTSPKYKLDDTKATLQFKTLTEPIWARSKEMRKQMIAAQSAAASGAALQQNLMQQQLNQMMIQTQMMQTQMMVQNQAMFNAGGAGA